MWFHRVLIVGLALGCQEYDLKGGARPPQDDDTTPDLTDSSADTGSLPTFQGPAIEVEPRALDFGILPPHCPSELQTVTIRNVGDADLDVEGIELVGNHHNAWLLAATPAVLPVGGSITADVGFRPPALADYGATALHIISNDPDEGTVVVDLAGLGAEEGVFTEQFQQSQLSPVDVLWVFDNSGSMGGEVDHLANTFHVFINAFVALGLDYHIGVVTTDMDDPTQSGRLQGPVPYITAAHPDPVGAFTEAVDLGTSGSATEKGLDAAYAALTPPLLHNENAGFVRPGTYLSIIVVTDENDSSAIRPLDFATWLNAYHGDPAKSSFSAVAGPKGGLFPCISFLGGVSAEPAPRYWTAVQNTGGQHISICDFDMTAILSRMAVVSAGLMVQFPLSHNVTDPAQIVVRINGNPVPRGQPHGWTYDANSNSVVFHGTATPPPGADVAITYPLVAVCP